jgi:outer membrane protein assembly factor BamB
VGELLDFAGFGGRAGRETPLAVADGRLFATTSTGRAYAFETCSFDLLGYCLY